MSLFKLTHGSFTTHLLSYLLTHSTTQSWDVYDTGGLQATGWEKIGKGGCSRGGPSTGENFRGGRGRTGEKEENHGVEVSVLIKSKFALVKITRFVLGGGSVCYSKGRGPEEPTSLVGLSVNTRPKTYRGGEGREATLTTAASKII